MSLYDQWKTASPYDDEPDPLVECLTLAAECERYIKIHAELSDITREERTLLESCRDTLEYVAEYIKNEI